MGHKRWRERWRQALLASEMDANSMALHSASCPFFPSMEGEISHRSSRMIGQWFFPVHGVSFFPLVRSFFVRTIFSCVRCSPFTSFSFSSSLDSFLSRCRAVLFWSFIVFICPINDIPRSHLFSPSTFIPVREPFSAPCRPGDFRRFLSRLRCPFFSVGGS